MTQCRAAAEGIDASFATGGRMNPRHRPAIILATILALFLAPAFSPAASAAVTTAKISTPMGCASVRHAGQLHCFGRIRAHKADNGRIAPLTVTSPTGLLPADLQSAYNVTGAHGSGRTVAIVDAYDDPKAESDLATYRSKT